RAGGIVGVDGQRDMLDVFEEGARAAGVPAVGTVLGAWPDVAGEAEPADVVVCGHVLYNVQDLAPFARALDDHALARVVVELTARHPLAWMNDLWEAFHGLRFPQGPTAADAADALVELGLDVRRDERVDMGHRGGGFERREDAVALVRRRLCLPADRDADIAEALGDRLREDLGRWTAGPHEQIVVTLWWDATAP
ncbi:MAG: SAM-dependent methyltransferase, partial [Actinobacteria bacterium]|nr:SAM-dependent methyltransferase [Actinomycetota bacterium]